MDRFQAMQLFTRIVALGSFTKAADDRQLPRATVTLAVQQLEKRLGTRLLNRTTRHVSATPDGQAYYERCQRLLGDLEETEAAFGSATSQPKGQLRVNLQSTVAKHFVLPVIADFFARYPGMELDLGLDDRLVDLVREGVDCVLRVGELSDSSLVGRRVASLQQVTCASRDYLARHGTPDTLADLCGHRAVNFLSTRSGKVLPFDFVVDGEPRSVQLKGVVTVSDADAYAACCIAHLGLVQMPRYHIEEQLQNGTLCEVLPQWRPTPMPVTVLYPHHRQLSPRVRVFVDWLAGVMGRVA